MGSGLNGAKKRRWSVELYFRDIKVSLGMNLLRCKSPEVVEKEGCPALNRVIALKSATQSEMSIFQKSLFCHITTKSAQLGIADCS